MGHSDSLVSALGELDTPPRLQMNIASGISSLEMFVPEIEQEWYGLPSRAVHERIIKVLRHVGPKQCLMLPNNRRVLDYSKPGGVTFFEFDDQGNKIQWPLYLSFHSQNYTFEGGLSEPLEVSPF